MGSCQVRPGRVRLGLRKRTVAGVVGAAPLGKRQVDSGIRGVSVTRVYRSTSRAPVSQPKQPFQKTCVAIDNHNRAPTVLCGLATPAIQSLAVSRYVQSAIPGSAEDFRNRKVNNGYRGWQAGSSGMVIEERHLSLLKMLLTCLDARLPDVD